MNTLYSKYDLKFGAKDARGWWSLAEVELLSHKSEKFAGLVLIYES